MLINKFSSYMHIKRVVIYAVLAMVVIFTTGCATHNAQYYYESGLKSYNKGYYRFAANNMENALVRSNNITLSERAQYINAKSYFLAKSYAKAIASLEAYQTYYNNPEVSSEITFDLAFSYYMLYNGDGRDVSTQEKALNYFFQIRETDFDYAQKYHIDDLIAETEKRIAMFEVYVANFYLRFERYDASVDRLNKALERFPYAQNKDYISYTLYLNFQAQKQDTERERVAQIMKQYYTNSTYTRKLTN